MTRLLGIVAALLRGRTDTFRIHAQARLVQIGLAAVFALATLVFVLGLATAALAARFGTIAAFAIMAGVSLLGLLAVLVALGRESRAHRARMARQAEAERRLIQTALLTLLPTLRRGGLLAAGLALLAFIMLGGRDRGGDDRS